MVWQDPIYPHCVMFLLALHPMRLGSPGLPSSGSGPHGLIFIIKPLIDVLGRAVMFSLGKDQPMFQPIRTLRIHMRRVLNLKIRTNTCLISKRWIMDPRSLFLMTLNRNQSRTRSFPPVSSSSVAGGGSPSIWQMRTMKFRTTTNWL